MVDGSGSALGTDHGTDEDYALLTDALARAPLPVHALLGRRALGLHPS